MRTDNGRMDRILANIRFYYIIAYMAVTSIVTVIPVRMALTGNPVNAILYPLLGIFGVAYLLVDFLYHHTLFRPRNCGLLVLFVISLIISCISNARYGFTDNLKMLIWTCIQLFLFSAIDTERPAEMHLRQLQIFTELFDAIWMCWAAWSLLLFLQQFHVTLQFPDIVNVTEMGFTQGRLFGIFIDPNYASLACFAAIMFAVLNLHLRSCSGISKAYHVLQILIQVCYIILGGSRTARLAIAVVLALLAALLLWSRLERQRKTLPVRAAGAVLGACLVVLGVMQGSEISQTALSYAPAAYEWIAGEAEQIRPDEDPEDPGREPGHNHHGNIHVDMIRPDVEESGDISNNRFQIWKDYVKVYLSAPIFGVSPRNAIQYTADHFDDLFIIERQYSVHNTYLALLVSAGTVGAALVFLWMILKAVEVLGYLIRRRNSRDRYYLPILLLTVILGVYAIAALPLYFMFFTNMNIDLLFWVTMGYVMGFLHMSEPERYRKPWPCRLMDVAAEKLWRKKA